MTVITRSTDVARHYASGGLEERILGALEAAGHSLRGLNVDDLAPVDGFHVRGRTATEELAALVDIAPGHLVLDVGSGLGGTARYLADRTGCRVIGVDLTDEYCRVAETLTDLVGLGRRVRFRRADALRIPCAARTFDLVWTEHAQMNIADKRGLYAELFRVLRPGGQLAFHDILAGPEPGLDLPLPWAGEAGLSHLTSADDLAEVLAEAGFELRLWMDDSSLAQEFLRQALARVRNEGPPPLGLHLLMGHDAGWKLANVLRGLEAQRLRVVKAVARRPSTS